MRMVPDTVLAPPSDVRIAFVESTYDVKLPEGYRSVLAEGNGGVPIESRLRCLGSERLISRFLCVLDSPKDEPAEGWADVVVVLSQIDDRLGPADEVGASLIPIAALEGGDFVCLDYRESRVDPSVVVWDHERSDVYAPFTHPVAPSFAEFESSLT